MKIQGKYTFHFYFTKTIDSKRLCLRLLSMLVTDKPFYYCLCHNGSATIINTICMCISYFYISQSFTLTVTITWFWSLFLTQRCNFLITTFEHFLNFIHFRPKLQLNNFVEILALLSIWRSFRVAFFSIFFNIKKEKIRTRRLFITMYFLFNSRSNSQPIPISRKVEVRGRNSPHCLRFQCCLEGSWYP